LIRKIETARVYLPLLKPARYKGAHGGRGSAKSHFFAEALVEKCLLMPGTRWVCVREVQRSLKDSVKRLVEDKIQAWDVGAQFGYRHDSTLTPGGGVILYQGMQDHTAESIKSLEGFHGVWGEEAQTMSARSLEMLRPTIRAPESELWFSWNPRSATDPVDDLLRGLSPPKDASVVRANWRDNPWFPKELEDERQHDFKARPDRYMHIWEGEYEPTAIGAIWDRLTLHRTRRLDLPSLTRIVVAIDPAVSGDAGSDEHGIIVVGIGEDKRGYVIDDLTCRGGPDIWSRTAVTAFDKWDADAVVIERNQGGDMCRHTLRTVRPTLPVIEVTATRGKHVRAEPIAALYAQDKISHIGTFPELEQQMCQMTAGGFQGNGSPDRVDALVWGLTQLFPSMTKAWPANVMPPFNPRHPASAPNGASWLGR
jgi:hypothetical protein